MSTSHRIGLIVPSSNTTMETEIPELLRRQQEHGQDTFTFHSSRMRMQQVSREELARMDGDSDRCALELSDARCDVLAYACLVAGYIEDAGVEVANRISLEVPDNLAVGRLDPADLLGHARRLDLTGVDALVLSACVQMPSLPAVQQVEDELGLPVVTAATATARSILLSLGITPRVREAGQLLAG